ncbi:hypothetical protein TNCV_676651 [Trichonephila clavipes]|nr:hypothetical protein TNCV_676651 [Trichonephila clavipes]
MQCTFIHWTLGVGPSGTQKGPDKLDLTRFSLDPAVPRGPVDLLRPNPEMSLNRHCGDEPFNSEPRSSDEDNT